MIKNNKCDDNICQVLRVKGFSGEDYIGFRFLNSDLEDEAGGVFAIGQAVSEV